MTKQQYQLWILEHQSADYILEKKNEDLIQLDTSYAVASVQFSSIEDNILVEISIISKKDERTKFYLHFELKEEEHAKKLFDEMVETLIRLKGEKKVRVLLSCSAGLTTSMFASMLTEAAATLGLDYEFNAVSYMNIYEEADNYDLILIAPQIGYMLNRLTSSLPDHLILQIPTAYFASYNTGETIQFIQKSLNDYCRKKNDNKKKICHCKKSQKRILSIVIQINKNKQRISYRLYNKNEVLDENLIIKPTYRIQDLYDIIDTLLLKYTFIDCISIATPGIVNDNKHFVEAYTGSIIDIHELFEEKYHISTYVFNNANAACVGFSLEHPEYSHIIFHSQPFGAGVGGQGIIANKMLLTGYKGIAGELRYYLHRMQLSDDENKLIWTEAGALEVVTKALLPSIITIGPEAVAISCCMTPDMKEIKKTLSSFIPEEYLPEFYSIQDPIPYMLDGLAHLADEII